MVGMLTGTSTRNESTDNPPNIRDVHKPQTDNEGIQKLSHPRIWQKIHV